MDFGPTSDATLLERALGGEPVDDAEIRSLVAVVESVRSLDRTGLAPHAEFVTSLRDRLLDRALGDRGLHRRRGRPCDR